MACGPVPSPRSNVSSCQPSHVSLPGTARDHHTTILSTGHTARLQAWGRGSSPHGQLSSGRFSRTHFCPPTPPAGSPSAPCPSHTLPLVPRGNSPSGSPSLDPSRLGWQVRPRPAGHREQAAGSEISAPLGGRSPVHGQQSSSPSTLNRASQEEEDTGSCHRGAGSPGVGIHTFLLSLVT